MVIKLYIKILHTVTSEQKTLNRIFLYYYSHLHKSERIVYFGSDSPKKIRIEFHIFKY